MGNGEIHVKGADGTYYGAPTMILHYVIAHDYLPPVRFIDAVRARAETTEMMCGPDFEALSALELAEQHALCVEVLRGVTVPSTRNAAHRARVEMFAEMSLDAEFEARIAFGKRWRAVEEERPYTTMVEEDIARFELLHKCMNALLDPRSRTREGNAESAAAILEFACELGGPRPIDALEAFVASRR